MNRLESFLRPYRSLTPDGGISFTLVIVLSVVAAFMAANIYYNQPLLDVIRQEMHTSEVAANFVTVVAQVGLCPGLVLCYTLRRFHDHLLHLRCHGHHAVGISLELDGMDWGVCHRTGFRHDFNSHHNGWKKALALITPSWRCVLIIVC